MPDELLPRTSSRIDCAATANALHAYIDACMRIRTTVAPPHRWTSGRRRLHRASRARTNLLSMQKCLRTSRSRATLGRRTPRGVGSRSRPARPCRSSRKARWARRTGPRQRTNFATPARQQDSMVLCAQVRTLDLRAPRPKSKREIRKEALAEAAARAARRRVEARREQSVGLLRQRWERAASKHQAWGASMRRNNTS